MSALFRMGVRCAAAAVVCTSLWVVVWLSAPAASSAAFTPEKTSAPFDPNEVDELVISGPSGSATVRRQGNLWRLFLGGRAVLADTDRIEALLLHLRALPLQPLANPGPDDLYGLERPWLTITLKSGARETGALVLGDRVLTEDARYARRPPLAGVFLVAGSDVLPLQVKGDLLRDYRLVPFPEEEISSVKVSRSEEELTLFRREGGFGLKIGEEAFPADPREARAFVAALAEARVLAFAPLPEMGLSEAEASLSVESRSGTAELLLLPTRSGLLARRKIVDGAGETEEDLVRLPEQALLWLSPSQEDLADRRVLAVGETAVVGRIKVRWGEEFAVLEKTPEEGWKLAAPRTVDLSETEVESFLEHLYRLKGGKEEAPPREVIAALKSPFGEISLFGPSWEEIAGLVLSAPTPDGSAYIQAKDGGPVVLLSPGDLSLLDLPGWFRR